VCTEHHAHPKTCAHIDTIILVWMETTADKRWQRLRQVIYTITGTECKWDIFSKSALNIICIKCKVNCDISRAIAVIVGFKFMSGVEWKHTVMSSKNKSNKKPTWSGEKARRFC
jgi:hypothetical protein